MALVKAMVLKEYIGVQGLTIKTTKTKEIKYFSGLLQQFYHSLKALSPPVIVHPPTNAPQLFFDPSPSSSKTIFQL